MTKGEGLRVSEPPSCFENPPMPPLDDSVTRDILPSTLARQVADRIHTIHVTHRLGRPASLLEGLAKRAAIPDSSPANEYCGPGARFVEAECGFPPSVYFYAGRACPSYGGAALAFPPESEKGRFDSATPFDTGGLVKREEELARAFGIELTPGSSRVDYCKESTAQATGGGEWRPRFAQWLAVYFLTLQRRYIL